MISNLRFRMKRIREKTIEGLIHLFAFGAIFIVLAMLFFLFREGGVIFRVTSWKNFLFGKIWLPTHSPPQFGILPLLWGSLMVTLGALLWSAPLGIGLAIYVAELASPKIRAILKAFVELFSWYTFGSSWFFWDGDSCSVSSKRFFNPYRSLCI